MTSMLDALWRAVAYCLHGRVIALSLLPLLLMSGSAWLLASFFWEPAVDMVVRQLASMTWVQSGLAWLESMGATGVRTMLGPLVVVMVATPFIVMGSLLLVAALMTPAMVSLVAKRRFPDLARAPAARLNWFLSAFYGLGLTLLAALLLVLSLPLWFIPPLALVLPPLIWGWLTYRILSFDVLSEHATSAERKQIVQSRRPWMLSMGILTGYLGAAPSLLWAGGAMMLPLAPILLPAAIWVYTLVFAFSSLWFAHYALSALNDLRAAPVMAPAPVTPVASETTTQVTEPPVLTHDKQGAGADIERHQ